jgi:replicative DNA helicase
LANYGELLLSKVIDNNDVLALKRFGVTRNDFHTKQERQAFDFLMGYAESNHNQTPSINVVLNECEFTYIPNTQDSYEYLTRELKSQSAKIQMAQLLEKKATEMFDTHSGFDFIDWLISESDKIKKGTDVRTKVGSNIKQDTETYLAEYKRRKAGKSFKVWRSHFPSVNEVAGGYSSGNMFALYGRSGRGKSVFALEEAIEAAQQGARVLYYALEMPQYEIQTRIFSSVSARQGIMRLNIGASEIDAGFEQRSLLTGKLDDEFEGAFEDFLKTINEHISGEITIRAIDDDDLNRIDVNEIERDILTLNPDFIVIDPIYLMDFERNDSMTAGGNVAETSKRLRRLCGRYGVVLLVITQAEEDKNQTKDREQGVKRELKIPTRSEMKKSKQILEDSAVVIALDTGDGRGILEIQKARAGGEQTIDVLFLPSYGLVRELKPSESQAANYEEVF